MTNDPMRILKADHREVEKLLDKLADSEEGTEREDMVDELATKLRAHMEAEESIVYPPVRAEVGEEDEEEAEIEHDLAREGLAKVQQMVEMPGFGAAVEMLKGGISHHVEEEETQLLPELKESLDREAWLAIGDALVEAKKAAGLPVPQPPRRKSTKRTKSTKSTKARAKA
jgi:iron-sulfur cluster repair protein YtfE (RIC family)